MDQSVECPLLVALVAQHGAERLAKRRSAEASSAMQHINAMRDALNRLPDAVARGAAKLAGGEPATFDRDRFVKGMNAPLLRARNGGGGHR